MNTKVVMAITMKMTLSSFSFQICIVLMETFNDYISLQLVIINTS